MTRVGVLTFHDTANHGAALQACATVETLVKLGYQAEVIDYTNSYRNGIYSPTRKIGKSLKNGDLKTAIKTALAFPLIVKRNRRFEEFYSRNLPKSKTRYFGGKSLKNIEDKYDVLLVGSDQVWSLVNNGNDSSYFLSFVQDKSKTISYASSFGTTNVTNSNIIACSSFLENINFLSVRERTGKDIIQELNDRVAEVVLDPVFLLNSSEWKLISEKSKFKSKKEQDFFVDYTSSENYSRRFFKVQGTEVFSSNIIKFGTSVSLNDLKSSNTTVMFTCGPEQFIDCIANSKLNFTSSFHGVVLSIIFKRKFIAILSGDVGRDSRIVDLLDMLGLADRIFRDDMSFSDIDREIDYEAVHSKLDILRNNSMDYLRESLASLNGNQDG